MVLSTPGHEGKAHELPGDTAWSYQDFAATAQKAPGVPVHYEVPTPVRERERLLSSGPDAPVADVMVALNATTRDGALAPTPGELSHLIGRPTEPLETTMRTWVSPLSPSTPAELTPAHQPRRR